MKKVTLAFLFIFSLIAAKATPINDSTAKLVGYNFLSAKFPTSKLSGVNGLALAYVAVDTNTFSKATTCYYVFNVAGTKGFVIVAADDNLSPILAYSTESNYGMNTNKKMPRQISDWMAGYTKKVATTIKNNIKASELIKAQWQQLSKPLPKAHYQLFGGGTTNVTPLLSTLWDQNSEYSGNLVTYNSLCPYDKKFGEYTLTGCVATAMAQIMGYWKYPSKGIGKHSYIPASYPYLGVQTVNFDSTNFDWTSMPDSLTPTSTPAQIKAVATLMYSCGVSVDMDYGVAQVDGSGSFGINYGNLYSNTAQDALVNNFNYDNGIKGIQRNNYSDSDWINIIKNELNAKRPVIYDGSGNQGGHCFVADGYDNNNLFHFNWGWSGYYNGYFDINNLSPAGDTFNVGQDVIIGIQPKLNYAANKNDSLALISFYDSASGSGWTNNAGWLNGPVSSWYGVVLDTSGRVTSLSLSGNNLSGTIASSLSSLNKLTTLDLSNNNFTGIIPASILNLDTLRTLDLSYNKFSGTIPNITKDSVRLSTLDLSNNQLTGSIPASFDKLFYLVTLDLSDNKLSGNLPSLIDDTTYLYTLSLANNQYSGTIPTAFLNGIPYINVLDLSGNQFSGSIPTVIYNLPYMYTLDLSNNKLSGTISKNIGNFYYITTINFSNNQFSGAIPSGIKTLTTLTSLDLSNNQFSGTVTTGFASLTGLFVLDISNNNFTFTGMNNIATISTSNNSVVYGPQAQLKMHYTSTKLTVGAGGTLSANTYKWYNASGLVYTKKGDSTYTPTVSGNYYAVITSTTASGLTLCTDTIAAGPLPISLADISATLSSGKILITWQTATELNTSHFIIQHSTNGTYFTNVGTEDAIGTGANSYSFTDNFPANGINYYRLESIDKDGTIAYSKVVTASLSTNTTISDYPNPSKGKLTINGEHIATVQVVDNLGKIINILSFKDASSPTVSVYGLQAGAYHLRVQTTDGKVSSVGFIKE